MKIIIASPTKVKTGGTELLHQLAYELNLMGIDTYIFYYNSYDNSPLNKSFDQYAIKYITNLAEYNNYNNVLIVPEIKTSLIYKYSNMQHMIWWLSVDNYINNIYDKTDIIYQILKNIVRRLLNRKMLNIKNLETPYNAFTFEKKDDKIIHLYQSYYALEFLNNHKIYNTYYLSDYINSIYLTNPLKVSKENIVLYNPKKGKAFTKRIIKLSKDINWVPLINLTNNEVKELLFRSKVYIDFGNHPGKDRFPREAAACGCCIITGRKGSAKNDKDIPIPLEFKLNDTIENIPNIIEKIKICLFDYDNQTNKFIEYRNYILNEQNSFKNDVYNIFNSYKENSEYAKE